MTKIEQSHNLIAYSLEMAVGGDIRGALSQIQTAKDISPFDFSVSMAAANMITEISKIMIAQANKSKNSHSEYATVQAWFKKNHNTLLPDFKLEPAKKDRYVPDFMLSIDGKKVPVECKKTFNDRSLNQLKAYMEYFKADMGYAVANKLKTKLPDNIIFIECPATNPEDV